ncbi:hypothetical protein GCM10009422_19230 [Brevundimonas kwangchunensis]|uniref:Lipoprotein n=1 Tax=Brevundimonas kwangchunensis TaxID=322163 RepID=A0ABN1GY78_9CAUL
MRKTLILTGAVTAALALTGCASAGGNDAPPPSWFNASGTTFEGWARVQGDEIRLFQEERDLTLGFPGDCVSAALPRSVQETARDVSSRKIRLTGRAVAWAERDGAQTWNWQGTRITNLCGRDTIVLADRVEVVQ